jgi:ribonuclease BN (tRNA processing enzyme)
MRFWSCEPVRVSVGRTCRLFASGVSMLAALAGASAAQGRAVPDTLRDTEVLLLGTHGGPFLSGDRSESSSLLIVDGRPYLIDCGIGTMRRLIRAGIRSETIRTIFITHHHPDHDLDLASVMANDFNSLRFAGGTDTVNIYGPPQTQELVEAAFRYISIPFGVFAAEPPGAAVHLRNPFAAHDIRGNGLVYQDDKIRVIAAENSHYALMPAEFHGRMQSYSYRFETPHGVVIYTGDTGPSDAVTQLAKGADVLVSLALDLDAMATSLQRAAKANNWSPELLHAHMAHMRDEILDLREVGELASKAHVKAVVLNHLGPDGVQPSVFVSGVKQYYSGPVFAGADFDRYCLMGQAGEKETASVPGPCR